MILVVDAQSPLTVREQHILYYTARGLSNKEIASRLSISEQTVKSHPHSATPTTLSSWSAVV